MKQILFLEDIIDNNIPIWYKNMRYQVLDEDDTKYKVFCEDMQFRGIDKGIENQIYEVIE